MPTTTSEFDSDLHSKIKWLMFARVLFTTLLLGSTIVFHLGEDASPLDPGLLVLYGMIISIFCLSAFYGFLLPRLRRTLLSFAYVQLMIDTVIVSGIIFFTGNYYSIFSVLYLVVIIYSSILLYKKGSMAIAVLCSLQYAALLVLEHVEILEPSRAYGVVRTAEFGLDQAFYKIVITSLACFAVALLSSFLAEQARRSKRELFAMENHVRRVEKLAAVGEMAAGLAHEIKNPLASLTGSIQILKESVDLEPDYARLMQIVLREADRLSSLVNNFLLFARPPVGRSEPIVIERAINEIVEFFEKDGNCRNRLHIRKHLTSGLQVEMDPVHLRQVLLNLLLNASEAINGSGTIDIRSYPSKDRQVCIQIADNGCGISPEIMKSIFDPFFTTKQNGTGLGLSIVHSILETYDSRLDVHSEEGCGTTLVFHLKPLLPS